MGLIRSDFICVYLFTYLLCYILAIILNLCFLKILDVKLLDIVADIESSCLWCAQEKAC